MVAASGTCEVASAGHLAPLLVHPDGTSVYLEIPPAPPLGIIDDPIHNEEFTFEDGSLLVLYTDGLIENDARDIADGMARLQNNFGPDSCSRPLDELAREAISGVYGRPQGDDTAVLIARLHHLPPDRHIAWTLENEPVSVSEARARIRSALKEWHLTEIADTTELLASELITNAVRYTRSEKIQVRLILERTLVCEVLDRSATLLWRPDDYGNNEPERLRLGPPSFIVPAARS